MPTTTVPPKAAPWPDDMVLTKAHARWLMDRGACATALDYVGWTVAAALKDEPDAALRLARDWLTDEQFAAAVRRSDPWLALKYAHNRMTDKQFAAAAKDALGAALAYAPDRYRRLFETA